MVSQSKIQTPRSKIVLPCHAALLFALEIESGGLDDLLDCVTTFRGAGFRVRQGTLGGKGVIVVRCGVGRSSAARAAQAVLDGHRPAWLISAGFAGALSPSLGRGEILVADHVIDREQHHAVDLTAIPHELLAGPAVRVGTLLTADRIIATAEEKKSLGAQFGALAVDMETAAVAEVCRRAAARFLAVRIISDAVDESLPPEIELLARQKSGAGRLGAALGAIVRRPGCLKDMLRLKQSALLASDRLAAYLARLIPQLPGGDDKVTG
jgi:adenosylhomocysteine nucleosidase